MLVVKIEVWPFGMKKASYTLNTIHICNDGQGDQHQDPFGQVVDEGHYDVSVHGLTPNNLKTKAKVMNHNRRNGALRLIRDALNKILDA